MEYDQPIHGELRIIMKRLRIGRKVETARHKVRQVEQAEDRNFPAAGREADVSRERHTQQKQVQSAVHDGRGEPLDGKPKPEKKSGKKLKAAND